MKKVVLFLSFTFLVILLSSCLETLHPIFTEKDLIYDARLIGTWKTDTTGGRAIITNLATESSVQLPGNISSISKKGYLISYKDKDGSLSGLYIAFLARIGKHLYFDYYPADKKNDKTVDNFFMVHLTKMHTSYRVNFTKDGFEMSQLDEGFIRQLIDEKKIRISHEKSEEDDIIITASTSELQQYIIKYGDEPSAYRSEKTIFKK